MTLSLLLGLYLGFCLGVIVMGALSLMGGPMIDFFTFWMTKPLAEMVIALVLVVLLMLVPMLPRWIKQARCKHPRVYETSACDAICRRCYKNLGFIGAWRAKRVRRVG